jgi:bis(5'-nucleosyl)-tetraphosphatase (symmetrical)
LPLYAIGEGHGCSRTLRRLLDTLPFAPSSDRLWLVGDLVGHGPDPLGVLRRVRELDVELDGRLTVVLGNHDLRLLAARDGVAVPGEVRGLLREVLDAADGSALLDWLSERPLLQVADELVLVHAGLLPRWTVAEASERAVEAGALLSSARRGELLAALYARRRDDSLPPALGRAVETLRAMTTVRTLGADGELCDHKGNPETAPPGCRPWFAVPERERTQRGVTVVFGHWASLGLRLGDSWIALDSGCAWGGPLTAVRLDVGRVFNVPRLD